MPSKSLTDTPSGSVDLLFLDPDWNADVDYWPELLRVLRPGGLLAIDNCISHAGEVAELNSLDGQLPTSKPYSHPLAPACCS